jgi:hypothetical protein
MAAGAKLTVTAGLRKGDLKDSLGGRYIDRCRGRRLSALLKETDANMPHHHCQKGEKNLKSENNEVLICNLMFWVMTYKEAT